MEFLAGDSLVIAVKRLSGSETYPKAIIQSESNFGDLVYQNAAEVPALPEENPTSIAVSVASSNPCGRIERANWHFI
jgi:hypothetical protein